MINVLSSHFHFPPSVALIFIHLAAQCVGLMFPLLSGLVRWVQRLSFAHKSRSRVVVLQLMLRADQLALGARPEL